MQVLYTFLWPKDGQSCNPLVYTIAVVLVQVLAGGSQRALRVMCTNDGIWLKWGTFALQMNTVRACILYCNWLPVNAF